MTQSSYWRNAEQLFLAKRALKVKNVLNFSVKLTALKTNQVLAFNLLLPFNYYPLPKAKWQKCQCQDGCYS